MAQPVEGESKLALGKQLKIKLKNESELKSRVEGDVNGSSKG